METVRLITSHTLFKLAIGLLIAFAVRLYMKRNGTPTHEDMVDELRTLLPPALLVGVGFLATSSGWVQALEGFLLALAVPLGVNSGKNGAKKNA